MSRLSAKTTEASKRKIKQHSSLLTRVLNKEKAKAHNGTGRSNSQNTVNNVE